MSKFCIKLEDVTLPDAIAAVVEAWYEAQNVDNLDQQQHSPFEPGDSIEIRDSAAPGSEWKRGWVFYKVAGAKIGICKMQEWCYVHNQPEYLVNGGSPGAVFRDWKESGCALRQPKNVRRIVLQPWEKKESNRLFV